MPSDLRSKPGKNRSKSQALRGARFKMVADSGYRGKTPALRMYLGAPSFGQRVNMAARPQFGFWAAVRQCLQNMWAQRHLGLFLFVLWMLVILCYFVDTEPTQMLRVFAFFVINMIILGFLPMYCCSLCWRR
ncbi:Fmr1 neighbor protein [Lemmus lemmus]